MENYEIHTERLFLRPLELKDAEVLFVYCSDPELSKYMLWEPHRDMQETIGFLADSQKRLTEGKAIRWGIFFEGKLCGLIGLEDMKRGYQMSAEIGYWLGEEQRGKGIMTESARAILAFGFQKLQLHKIIIGSFAENEASKHVIERLGFRFVGVRKEHFFKRNEWHDDFRYEMLESGFSIHQKINT